MQASQLVDIRNGDVIQFMCVTRDEVRPEVAEVVTGRPLRWSANVLVFPGLGLQLMLGRCLSCLVVTVRGTEVNSIMHCIERTRPDVSRFVVR